MDDDEDIDGKSMDNVSETSQEKIKQGPVKKKGQTKWTRGSNVSGHVMSARHQKKGVN